MCVENFSQFNIWGKCFLCWCIGVDPDYFFFPVLLNPPNRAEFSGLRAALGK